MCKLHSYILNERTEKELTNSLVAERMSKLLGKPVDSSTVGKYFSNQQTGVPLKKLEAFLSSFGLRVITDDEVVISKHEYDAMLTFADKGVQSLKTAR